MITTSLIRRHFAVTVAGMFSFAVCTQTLMVSSNAFARELVLPEPTQMLKPSAAVSYPVLKGLSIDPNDPLKLEFIIDTNDKTAVDESEARRLVDFFLAAVALPKDDLWVNLSPYEQDRMVTDELGATVLGEEMLAQDYLLKQLSSSLTDPNTELGKTYWSSVGMNNHSPAQGAGAETLKKIWITPQTAQVYEKGNSVFVTDAVLDIESEDATNAALLPAIKKEVNEGENFAPIRQLYHSVILGLWFKQKLHDSIYGTIIDKKNVNGIDAADAASKDKVFNAYVDSFKKGVYSQMVKTKEGGRLVKKAYFSGGEDFAKTVPVANSAVVPQFKGETLSLVVKMGAPSAAGSALSARELTEKLQEIKRVPLNYAHGDRDPAVDALRVYLNEHLDAARNVNFDFPAVIKRVIDASDKGNGHAALFLADVVTSMPDVFFGHGMFDGISDALLRAARLDSRIAAKCASVFEGDMARYPAAYRAMLVALKQEVAKPISNDDRIFWTLMGAVAQYGGTQVRAAVDSLKRNPKRFATAEDIASFLNAYDTMPVDADAQARQNEALQDLGGDVIALIADLQQATVSSALMVNEERDAAGQLKKFQISYNGANYSIANSHKAYTWQDAVMSQEQSLVSDLSVYADDIPAFERAAAVLAKAGQADNEFAAVAFVQMVSEKVRMGRISGDALLKILSLDGADVSIDYSLRVGGPTVAKKIEELTGKVVSSSLQFSDEKVAAWIDDVTKLTTELKSGKQPQPYSSFRAQISPESNLGYVAVHDFLRFSKIVAVLKDASDAGDDYASMALAHVAEELLRQSLADHVTLSMYDAKYTDLRHALLTAADKTGHSMQVADYATYVLNKLNVPTSASSLTNGGVNMKDVQVANAGTSMITLDLSKVDQAIFADGISFKVVSLNAVAKETILAGL